MTEIHPQDSSGHLMKDPARLVHLTDGVFSIIMTLLVLEIKVPGISQGNGSLYEQLKDCSFQLFLFGIGFLLAGVYWMSHRMLFSMVKKVNSALLWLNILFLMFCSLIPFGAALLGRFPKEALALMSYGVLLAVLAGWRLLMYIYITSHHELIYYVILQKRRRRVLKVMIFAPVMFIISVIISSWLPTIALLINAFTPPMFVTAIGLANRDREEKKKP